VVIRIFSINRRTGRFTDLNSPKQRSRELRLGRKDFPWIDHRDFFYKMQGCFQVVFSKDFWPINSTVIEKYMAQCLHISVCWPFTNLPFGIRAIIFDLKVLRTALSRCVFWCAPFYMSVNSQRNHDLMSRCLVHFVPTHFPDLLRKSIGLENFGWFLLTIFFLGKNATTKHSLRCGDVALQLNPNDNQEKHQT